MEALFLLLGEEASLLRRGLVERRVWRGLAMLVNVGEGPLVVWSSKRRGFHRVDDSTNQPSVFRLDRAPSRRTVEWHRDSPLWKYSCSS